MGDRFRPPSWRGCLRDAGGPFCVVHLNHPPKTRINKGRKPVTVVTKRPLFLEAFCTRGTRKNHVVIFTHVTYPPARVELVKPLISLLKVNSPPPPFNALQAVQSAARAWAAMTFRQNLCRWFQAGPKRAARCSPWLMRDRPLPGDPAMRFQRRPKVEEPLHKRKSHLSGASFFFSPLDVCG